MRRAKHAADLPEPTQINPELKFRYVNHLLDRNPTKKRRGPGLGTVLVLVLLSAMAMVAYYAITEIVERLT